MIKSNTGKGKANKAADVIILQLLFNQVCLYASTDSSGHRQCSFSMSSDASNLPNLKVDGRSTLVLVKRIEDYQRAKGSKVVDGWIGAHGNTLKALLIDAGVSSETSRMTFIRSQLRPVNLTSINIEAFLILYAAQYGAQSANDKDGLRYIIKTAKADAAVKSLNEFAYMLATTKHETAHTFRAIGEYGKGASRSYGKEITVTDPATKKVYKNKYYGRGYVQLTWGYNYQRIDHQLGNGTYPNKNKSQASQYNTGFTIINPTKSIYLNPDKALEKEVAYVGLVWGMQAGIYTARTIGRYVNATKVDYINARRVINGTDKANSIAKYAENFEVLLRVAATTPITSNLATKVP